MTSADSPQPKWDFRNINSEIIRIISSCVRYLITNTVVVVFLFQYISFTTQRNLKSLVEGEGSMLFISRFAIKVSEFDTICDYTEKGISMKKAIYLRKIKSCEYFILLRGILKKLQYFKKAFCFCFN